MSSLKQISKITGLSIATVSHVINGTRKVSDKSTELVMQAIKDTGYKPNYAARMLRTRKSDTIAMLIPEVKKQMSTNIFFMDALSGAKDFLQSVGLNLIIATYAEDNADNKNDLKNLKVLQNQWIDGFLVVPNKKKTTLIKNIIKNDNPFVLLDRALPELKCSCVYNDAITVSAKVVKLLTDSGKKRIGYIGGSVNSFTGYDRMKGYKQGLTECGMVFDQSCVATAEKHTVAAGYNGMEKLLKNGVDAVYVANDVQAMGVLKYLQEKNIKVPEQMSVVGYENYEWMEILPKPLTTVCQQPYEMGRLGAEILYKKLEDPEYEEEIVLQPEIILRNTHA